MYKNRGKRQFFCLSRVVHDLSKKKKIRQQKYDDNNKQTKFLTDAITTAP